MRNEAEADVAEDAFPGVIDPVPRQPYRGHQDEKVEDDIPDGHMADAAFRSVIGADRQRQSVRL